MLSFKVIRMKVSSFIHCECSHHIVLGNSRKSILKVLMIYLINITNHVITDMHVHVMMVIYSVRVNQLNHFKIQSMLLSSILCENQSHDHQNVTL